MHLFYSGQKKNKGTIYKCVRQTYPKWQPKKFRRQVKFNLQPFRAGLSERPLLFTIFILLFTLEKNGTFR